MYTSHTLLMSCFHHTNLRPQLMPVVVEDWVARQRPKPTPRQGCTCWVPTGDRPWHLILKLSLSQKVGLQGRSCHPIWDLSASGLRVARDWWTFCHLGSKIGWRKWMRADEGCAAPGYDSSVSHVDFPRQSRQAHSFTTEGE